MIILYTEFRIIVILATKMNETSKLYVYSIHRHRKLCSILQSVMGQKRLIIILPSLANFASHNLNCVFIYFHKTVILNKYKCRSNNKSDPSHNPSFKSCMIRIPGSFNSKCILEGKDPEVRIIQRWEGYRPKINLLLGSFHANLVDQKIRVTKAERTNKEIQKKIWK
jgi:hypothetical protein